MESDVLTVMTLGALVWGGAAGLNKVKFISARFSKAQTALVLGPILGAASYGAGKIVIEQGGWMAWVYAVLMGLMGTFAAAIAQDKLVKPVSGK